MDDRRTPEESLAALGAHLASRRMNVELTGTGLRVVNTRAAGCCAEAPHASDLITCRPRPGDAGRWWFFTSWSEPIARSDQIGIAAVLVLDHLGAQA
ncbi:hypothetical protein [Actinomadura fibrosa]|uniref:Uncharacterized protein n=1 Tax=Actinomadura fibrosa TaxID=111802 RepID=A0ABW2XGA6_9ACTN|nr:hypothetical protein [Actinomadura fibrosa]